MEKSAPEIDASLPAAAFTMAQISVETGQPDKAIEWLENPKFGPLTLVKAGSPLWPARASPPRRTNWR